MNKIVEQRQSMPAKSEAQYIGEAAQEDAGFEKMLKFKKGHYYMDNDEVPLGTQLVAHTVGWTKCWIKFVEQKVAARHVYRMIRGDRPVDRDELDDNDHTKWAMGLNGQPRDPWTLQYLLPMEDPETGAVFIFVTGSFGGRRAVADVCAAWGRKAVKQPGCGQPIIRLRETMMPSKKFGDVPRPLFEIIGWDGVREGIDEVNAEELKREDLDDEIPF